jgi:uncharacterized membrane protein
MNRTSKKWLGIAAAVALGVAALGIARAQTAVPQSLVFAVYDTPNGAADAYKSMKDTQRQGVIHIDSFAVVSKDDRGRVRVHSTQRRGARAGAIVGALVGAVGGPVGALAGAGAGGGIGYLTGSAVGIPRGDINAIKSSLQPGSSALIAVVDEVWVADLERSLHEANAKQVLDRRLAGTTEQNEAPSENAPPANPPANP